MYIQRTVEQLCYKYQVVEPKEAEDRCSAVHNLAGDELELQEGAMEMNIERLMPLLDPLVSLGRIFWSLGF